MAQLLEKMFKPFIVLINFITGIVRSTIMFFSTAVKLSGIVQTFWAWVPDVFMGLLVLAVGFIILKIIKDLI